MTPLPASNAKAQSLGEVSLGLGIVAFSEGEGETTQILFAQGNTSPGSQSSEDPLVAFHFGIQIQGLNDHTCRQTFEKTLLQPEIFGLPMLSISKGTGFITVDDGRTVEEHHIPCIEDGRIAVLIFVPVPPDRVVELAANPRTVPAGVRIPSAFTFDLAGPFGETRAAASYWDSGFVILDVTDPANP